jgi:hypothetical protein
VFLRGWTTGTGPLVEEEEGGSGWFKTEETEVEKCLETGGRERWGCGGVEIVFWLFARKREVVWLELK